MSVGETTRLTAIWGAGILLAMGAAGGWLIKNFGYIPVLRVGLVVGILVFFGLVLSGALNAPLLFLVLVFFLGVSTGLSAAGMLSAVIEFTTLTRAGLLMGIWGLAHEFGQAIGSLLSGAIVDLGRILFSGSALISYGTVFSLEAVLLIIALSLVSKVDLTQSAILTSE
jgi:BCD family chlorophyll transporter-like MFS transporter